MRFKRKKRRPELYCPACISRLDKRCSRHLHEVGPHAKA